MKQKLSAMKYIKNNKRRITVLVVSLGLCFLLIYLTNFLLSSTEATFSVIGIDNPKKVQYVSLAGSTLGIDVENLDTEELNRQYEKKNLELIEKLKDYESIKEVYYAQILYNGIQAVIGEWWTEIPLVDKEQVPVIIEHYGTKIYEGRMPENPGEIVLDRGSMNNGGYVLNDYYNSEEYDTAFKIVGILDCDTYFGCGIPSDKTELHSVITILSDGSIYDLSKLLEQEGIYVRETYDTIVDAKTGEKEIKVNVTDVISSSTTLIYICIIILSSLALFIVYIMYLRDRHNEWCLYCSIGYSRKEIYSLVMRELLFVFGIALVIGIGLAAAAVVAIDFFMLTPQGMKCKYFYPDAIVEILCAYVLLVGALQIPIRYALHRIRTIDAMDDDLY